jgi:hypothetical protein
MDREDSEIFVVTGGEGPLIPEQQEEAEQRPADGHVEIQQEENLSTSYEVHPMSETEKQRDNTTSAWQRLSVHDILYVAFLLARKKSLPVDLVNQILDTAEYWLEFESESNRKVYGKNNMNDLYLSVDIPKIQDLLPQKGLVASKCRRFVVDCASKDQGWATWEPEHNQTYNGSSSSSELAVVKQTEDQGLVESPRFRVCHNFRAYNKYRHHRKYFTNPNGILKYIDFGSTVQLFLLSQFPGWTNSCKYGRLRVSFAIELMEDYAFDGVVDTFQHLQTLRKQQQQTSKKSHFFQMDFSTILAFSLLFAFLSRWMNDV